MASIDVKFPSEQDDNAPVLGSRRLVRAGLYNLIKYVHENREPILKRINEVHPELAKLTDEKKLGTYLGYMLDDLITGTLKVAPLIEKFEFLVPTVTEWETHELADVEKYGITNY